LRYAHFATGRIDSNSAEFVVGVAVVERGILRKPKRNPDVPSKRSAIKLVHAFVDLNLFSGAGGLALGLKAAGVAPRLLFERDGLAFETCQTNGLVGEDAPDFELHKGDVRNVDWTKIQSPVRVLAGGVPCQPWSRGGKHEAQSDARNLFPEALRAIRELRPRAVLIENVHGLLRPSFRHYLQYLLRSLEFPSLLQRRSERWQSHNVRLREKQASRGYEPEYSVWHEGFNAADYGVPQLRRRVFIVALPAGSKFAFPKPTHSRGALVRAQADGSYWKRYGIGARIRHAKRDVPEDDKLFPWVTVRDAIGDLPAPSADEESAARGKDANHWSIPGARRYDGHDGSDLDWPSKTIKAGVHGVPGGENTVRDGHRFRYYTLREAAMIQTFPRGYVFEGARIHVTRQIGNAVPPLLAKAVAGAVATALAEMASPQPAGAKEMKVVRTRVDAA
jgi:DNA (cytosine-5)-methyltransferase 1